jgi:hypothetical protein
MSPETAVISGLVALATLVFAIFGASWLNQRATDRMGEQMEKRFDSLEKMIDSKFNALSNELHTRSQAP